MVLQLYREANPRPDKTAEEEEDDNGFGYGFYGDIDDALSSLTKSSRRAARNIGTKIALLDY